MSKDCCTSKCESWPEGIQVSNWWVVGNMTLIFPYGARVETPSLSISDAGGDSDSSWRVDVPISLPSWPSTVEFQMSHETREKSPKSSWIHHFLKGNQWSRSLGHPDFWKKTLSCWWNNFHYISNDPTIFQQHGLIVFLASNALQHGVEAAALVDRQHLKSQLDDVSHPKKNLRNTYWHRGIERCAYPG